MRNLPLARVYVDGFNLYRRALAPYPELKWLDVCALVKALMPEFQVDFVHYFTANLKPGFVPDSSSPARQQIYLRALRANCAHLKIHFGKFRRDIRHYPKHPLEFDKFSGEPVLLRVRKVEEKGSDVNLASRLVLEASLGLADIFVILTNDSDQVGPLKLLRDELGMATGIIFPMSSARSAKELMQTEPRFTAFISRDALLSAQLPDTLADQHGTIRRPQTWGLNSEGPVSGAL